MDRSELAGLLAATMHSSGSRPRYPHGPSPLRNPSLSPRPESQLQFQSLGNRTQYIPDDEQKSARRQGPQHVSTVRVQCGHSRPTVSRANAPSSYASQKPAAEDEAAGVEANVEPDFIIEERQAWSRTSPKTTSYQANRYYTDKDISETFSPKTIKNIPVLRPTPKSIPLSSPQKEPEPQTLHLQVFAPVSPNPNVGERPKTSRGQKAALSLGSADVEEEHGDHNSASAAAAEQHARRSKFLEGSMTKRSKAVASAWDENVVLVPDSNRNTLVDDASEETDSEATPQATRMSRDGVPSDHDEMKAPPTTPATARRGIFRFGSTNPRASQESQAPAEEKTKRTKKGLRKSLSTWNFHNLGDRIKKFGNSTTDLIPKSSVPLSRSNLTAAVDGVSPEERKRKAEEAYALQFGSKRRKSNSHVPETVPVLQEDPASIKTSSMKRRTLSSSHSHSSLSTSMRNRRASLDPQPVVSQEPANSSDIDARKRPSRKDLEKENQQLRAMLRRSRSMSFDAQAKASRSSVHLPLEEERDPLGNGTRNLQENLAQGNRVSMAPGTKVGRRGEVIPPVPQIPRSVLGGLENGSVNNASSGRTRAIMPEGLTMLPRPVSSILELDESEADDGYLDDVADTRVVTGRETWEWPDDVF